jgi:hypothetical protein
MYRIFFAFPEERQKVSLLFEEDNDNMMRYLKANFLVHPIFSAVMRD